MFFILNLFFKFFNFRPPKRIYVIAKFFDFISRVDDKIKNLI